MAGKRNLFISYAHDDMRADHWLDRLRLYLAPLRTSDVAIWDDSRIEAGQQWNPEIETALHLADAAILLVGPAFLASDYINTVELPRLLDAAERRGIRILPLVVGYCMYTSSVLGRFQAFNDPSNPMEALAPAEQNKLLNGLSISADEALRHPIQREAGPAASAEPSRDALMSAMIRIQRCHSDTHAAFEAQCERRDHLVDAINTRLGIHDESQYERFFIRYYDKLNTEERFEFDQIRALTEGPMLEGNKTILETLDNYPRLLDEVTEFVDLRQHLVFWLNKYERVFVKTPGMCLLYTGVEDGVPFPAGLDEAVTEWIQRFRGKAALV